MTTNETALVYYVTAAGKVNVHKADCKNANRHFSTIPTTIEWLKPLKHANYCKKCFPNGKPE